MSQKKALITGIFGQDGSYLCELLSDKGYKVYGIEKQPLPENSRKIKKYLASKGCKPALINCDLYSYDDVARTIKKIGPDEVYHLAAKHYSSQSKGAADKLDRRLFNENVSSTLNLLVVLEEYSPKTRCVLIGSCLMFDASKQSPQNERTPFKSGSMYGLAKIIENRIGRHFRGQGMHVSMAIFYNHESPRRSESFVTKKIVKNMVLVKKGKIEKFELGNLEAVKDWGYAKDYVKGLWKICRQKTPRDYILATGQGHTVRDFIEETSKALGINDWCKHITINPGIISRKVKINLIGDASLARTRLRWENTVNFHGLVRLMVESELKNNLD